VSTFIVTAKAIPDLAGYATVVEKKEKWGARKEAFDSDSRGALSFVDGIRPPASLRWVTWG